MGGMERWEGVAQVRRLGSNILKERVHIIMMMQLRFNRIIHVHRFRLEDFDFDHEFCF